MTKKMCMLKSVHRHSGLGVHNCRVEKFQSQFRHWTAIRSNLLVTPLVAAIRLHDESILCVYGLLLLFFSNGSAKTKPLSICIARINNNIGYCCLRRCFSSEFFGAFFRRICGWLHIDSGDIRLFCLWFHELFHDPMQWLAGRTFGAFYAICEFSLGCFVIISISRNVAGYSRKIVPNF